jgi:hypothetical protein
VTGILVGLYVFVGLAVVEGFAVDGSALGLNVGLFVGAVGLLVGFIDGRAVGGSVGEVMFTIFNM